ncbi:hypothetical protein Tco_0597088 [Tanacetum coccineum]
MTRTGQPKRYLKDNTTIRTNPKLLCLHVLDLAKLVSHVQPSFKDLDSPEDDLVIIVDDSNEDEDDEVHATENVETEDTSVPKSSSHGLLKLKSLPTKSLFFSLKSTNWNLRRTKLKLKLLSLKLNPHFPMWNNSKSCWVKETSELEIELPGDLKEIPTKLDDFTKNVTRLTSQVVELKTL